MGTRHITAVYLDGNYKVAQYGQWDGYPEGAGMNVLNFARTIADETARKSFAEKVRACTWLSPKEERAINQKIQSGALKNWQMVYPEFSRDTGSDILKMIVYRDAPLKLQNNISFVADSLFCEWVWLIDLDAGRFEGYEGFCKVPPEEGDRWYFLKDYCENGYYTPVLACDFPLDDLPTDDEFLNAFKTDEQEA